MLKATQFFFLGLSIGLFVSCGGSGTTENEGGTTDSIVAAPQPAAATGFSFDALQTKVMFMATKAKGGHYGSFNLKSGSIEITDAGIKSGNAAIDLNSLAILDPETPEDKKGELKGHLLSPDFFNAPEFPEISLKITGSSAYAGTGETAPAGLPAPVSEMFVTNPTHTLTGMINIKGADTEISFPAKVEKRADLNYSINAFFTLDRTKVGLRFMSDTEKVVNPEIRIAISAVVIPQGANTPPAGTGE